MRLLLPVNVSSVESETHMGRPNYSGTLSVAWWNTSISPYGNGNTHVDEQLVIDTILRLSSENDLLGLGEFADESVKQEVERNLSHNKKFTMFNANSGREKFQTAFVYDSSILERIELDQNRANFYKSGSGVVEGQYRVGQKARFRIRILDAIVDVYFIHWNQKDDPCGEMRKAAAAERIYRDMFGDEQRRVKDAAAIVMGDFNTEPSSSVFVSLGVSRSPQYVCKHGGVFNPFWRRLHDDNGTLNGENRNEIKCGKCLFDSIMVTAAFMNLPSCKLHERIYGCKYYIPRRAEHSPVGLKIVWKK